MWTNRYPKDKEIGEAIQMYLTDLGADVRFEVLEWSAFSASRRDPVFEICWQHTGPRPPDPGMTALDLAIKCDAVLNLSTYCNPEFDAILNEALKTVDPEKRRGYYNQAQEFIRDEYVGIYIGSRYDFMAVRKEVKNFEYTAVRHWLLFMDTYLEE